MHIINELDEYGRHIIAFEHLHKARRLSAPPETWNYLDNNTEYFNLHMLPTDYTLKAIFNASDNGLLTREGITRTLTSLFRENRDAVRELDLMFEGYDVYAFSRESGDMVNTRFMREHGFHATKCVSFMIYSWHHQDMCMDKNEPLHPNYIVPAHEINCDLADNFAQCPTILKCCDSKTRSGKVKFPESCRNLFCSAAVDKVYKNGRFEVQYSEPLHRLYLTAMRFEERIEKVRTTLEVQDKLAGLLD